MHGAERVVHERSLEDLRVAICRDVADPAQFTESVRMGASAGFGLHTGLGPIG
jgi:hypothetical protein